MRAIHLIPVSILIACGPAAPPVDGGSTSATSSSGSTTGLSEPTLGTTTSTVGTTTSTATTGGVAETGTTVDFVAKPDVDGGILPCDVWKQDCPAGQKCVPYAEGGGVAWNALKCVDITGDGAVGDPCTVVGGGGSGIDDCALGMLCWDVDERGHGTCVAMCSGSPDGPTCPPKSSCSISGDGALNICIFDCDPLLQDCPGADLCIPVGEGFLCAQDDSGDGGQVNDPCEYANTCDPGLVCLNTANASVTCQQGSQGCCQPFCEFPGSPCPNPDQQCLPWYDPMMPIPPGNEDVGVCAIPQ